MNPILSEKWKEDSDIRPNLYLECVITTDKKFDTFPCKVEKQKTCLLQINA